MTLNDNIKVKGGRFKQDPETGEFIPSEEFNAKYARKRFGEAPMIICSRFETYQSPVTGKVISTKTRHENELKATGSRVYEGRGSEQRMADRHNQYQEDTLMDKADVTMNQTYHDMEHGYHHSSTEGLTWDIGDE